ncbi:GNAT family N-acetyltransferase [Nonomuraea jiangxiensis]|uniref:Acetyltransferase (GNAT) family protein n=1 Tax=Nonomuraea jiangxiensis TaxID=633440 RepID=A0A1G8F8U7_9ACTN|nr:GNAT family N-acetyltransferase [Nonomuraea jiangxiensis]SDH78505.1 Acetyltransferase (GNAT) family protein [Nonomuraea jiangxiensis]
MFDLFPEPARSQLVAAFDEGRSRPEWCFAEGQARLSFWAPFAGAEPVIIWPFDPGPDPATAAGLLRRSLHAMGLKKMIHDISLRPGLHPVVDRAVEHEALTLAGFAMEVERLSLEWVAGSDLPADPGRLTYRPALRMEPGEVLDLLVRISQGSLDHDTRVEVATAGAAHEARWMYDDLVNRKAKPSWFVIGYLGDSPVGLVAPDDHSIAYIGVVPEHRGHGYVDDLLARGTRTLAEAGLQRIVAATDVANVPTANAFLRAGYSEVGRVFRYYWRSS